MEKYYIIEDKDGYVIYSPTCDSREEAIALAKRHGIKRSEIASVKVAFSYKYFCASLSALKKCEGDRNKSLILLDKAGYDTYNYHFANSFSEAVAVFDAENADDSI